MKTLWIEDEDALNVGRVIVTKTGTHDCTVCYSCDEREDYENRLKADMVAMLDKIRAEIDKARFIDKDTRIVKNALASGLEVALKIIDKYKGESERT